MKKRCLCTILCFALALVLSAASASESEAGTLVELWLKHDDSYDAELIRNGDARVTDESVPVGGSIDGFDIAGFTWERLTGKDCEDYPHTAEGLLLCFRPYSGDASFHGFDSGFLQSVNYRFGESKVSLIDNELFCTNYALGDSVYVTQYAIYRFSIKTGSYAGDLLVVDVDPLNDGSPDCLSVTISENETAYHDERAYHPERGDIGVMQVVNCDEWVSLREKPSAASARIRKVGRQEYVQAYHTDGDFTYCNVKGLMGYIKSEYLERNEDCEREEAYYADGQ